LLAIMSFDVNCTDPATFLLRTHLGSHLQFPYAQSPCRASGIRIAYAIPVRVGGG